MIDNIHILTAAHCVKDDKGIEYTNLYAAVDIVNDSDFDKNKIKVIKTYSAPPAGNYCLKGTVGPIKDCVNKIFPPDLAILKLEKVVSITPIKIFNNELTEEEKKKLSVVDFGDKSFNVFSSAIGSNKSSELREKEVYIDTSASLMDYKIKTKDGKSAIARGDSGGPLIFSKDDNYYLVGININTPDSSFLSSLSLRVCMYKNWIDFIITPASRKNSIKMK